MLPARFLQFWYPDSLEVAFRVWKNSLQVIEEDLAVGLMWRLLFTPLYHDSSWVGSIVSFFFRLSRILMGYATYFAVSVGLILVYLIWFLLPLLIPVSFLVADLRGFLFFEVAFLIFGLALFIDKLVIDQPHKKVWQIKDIKDIFKATKVKKNDLTCEKLISSPEVVDFLLSLELDPTRFTFCSNQLLTNSEVLANALKLAQNSGAKFLTPVHFFVADLLSNLLLDQELLKYDLKKDDFLLSLRFFEQKRQKWRQVMVWDDDFSVKHLKGVNRGWLSTPTHTLDLYSQDLTRVAAMNGFPDFIGRTAALTEVITILSQVRDRNVLLVGPAGVGKTALVDYLAKLIVKGDAPAALSIKRIVKLDLSSLLSGIEHEGDLATKIQAIFSEIESSGNIIVFIDEIHNLGTGEAGKNYNLYALLQPYLESNTFQFISSTEPENYAKTLEKNAEFARIFHKVELSAATNDETLQILEDRSVDLQRIQGVNLTFKAAKSIVEYSHKLIHDLVLPDSALSILEECIASATEGIINVQTVKSVLEKRVNIPVIELDSSQKQNLLNLEQIIHQKMIDQQEAVKKVADTLRRAATVLKDSKRPIGSFLFVGPTGVGKTELAKILSEVYFKNKAAFLRFDMSEYQTPVAIDRLIGNQENPGELTEAVRSKPYSLILLDEFEKADPKILTLFLQVLEDGRLTDATGKTTDFTNSIIIATSNAASLLIAGGLTMHEDSNQLESEVREELLKVYKPELINRFDSIVIFKSLSHEDLLKVVRIKLNDLQNKLKEQGYLIDFDEALIQQLAKTGFDPVLGARPLRRLIQDTVESKLSKMILEEKLVKGQLFPVGIDSLNP